MDDYYNLHFDRDDGYYYIEQYGHRVYVDPEDDMNNQEFYEYEMEQERKKKCDEEIIEHALALFSDTPLKQKSIFDGFELMLNRIKSESISVC